MQKIERMEKIELQVIVIFSRLWLNIQCEDSLNIFQQIHY